MRADFFDRLPPPTAILLLSALLPLTTAQIIPLPRRTPPPTTTLAHHALNVVPFPLLAATPAPQNPFDLRRRQDGLNTVCGFIGGDSQLPATCGAGSHCVMDVDNNVVGCCPNGQATCTEGIYTGCVDRNSGPQSAVNPYVFTCQGGNVCYQNFFDGGMSMFGCGTASNLGTTVLATATLSRPSGRPTGTPFSRFSETRISIKTVLRSTTSTRKSSSTSSSTESSTTSSTTSSSTSQPTSSTSTTSSNPSGSTSAPGTIPVASGSSDRLGPIIGGSLGGAAVFLALLAFALFFFRRRRNNARQGPGPSNLKTAISPPRSANGSGFEPLHQSSEAFETGLAPPIAAAQAYGHPGAPGAPSPFTYYGAAAPHTSYPPAGAQHVSYPPMQQQQQYQYPGQFPGAYAAGAANPVFVTGAAAMGAAGATDSDRTPLTAGGYTDAVVGPTQPHTLDRIGEEEEEDRAAGSGGGGGGGSGGAREDTGQGGDNRPLWQQNRRQSRNQVWM
ncbi:hypothetical protein B0T18DRAFT_480848 [Schizothecium vesticola]|uniref:Mid2 domain-containing protein n=1 Tax=Schizothecium vesticola TaxID=314040 RepID=A0AA40EVV6_9PEZI|nr:hypothetical protein B0T18DRAFT_480848 [Schizothecium vesticola]